MKVCTCGHVHLDDSRLQILGENKYGVFANCLLCGTTLLKRNPEWSKKSESMPVRGPDPQNARSLCQVL